MFHYFNLSSNTNRLVKPTISNGKEYLNELDTHPQVKNFIVCTSKFFIE